MRLHISGGYVMVSNKNYELINNFLIFNLKGIDLDYFDDVPNKTEADSFLGYCYLDKEFGMMVAIIALVKTEGVLDCISTCKNVLLIPYSELEDYYKGLLLTDALSIEQIDGLHDHIMERSRVTETVKLSREIKEIDHLRDPYHPDIINVAVIEDDNIIDNILMEIVDYDSGFSLLMGMVVSQSKDAGYLGIGRIYPILIRQETKGKAFAYIDVSVTTDPTEMLKIIYGDELDLSDEELDETADRSCLEIDIDLFRDNPTIEGYEIVIESIKECILFFPCIVDISIDDIDRCDEMIGNIRSDYKLFSEYVEGKDGIKINPRFMNMDGDKVVLPLFTSEEEIEEIDMTFTPIPLNIREAINFVNNSGNHSLIKAIVINPTSSPFVIDREMFEEFE